ncbi:hypothetical protein [Brenneria alni]|uniref:hypothetical protein n=1 Tax=Brenneria alni TaxID=71656 RepID=UPI0011C46A3A|nr:hypothetical protein [Brenneria alni]
MPKTIHVDSLDSIFADNLWRQKLILQYSQNKNDSNESFCAKNNLTHGNKPFHWQINDEYRFAPK